MGRKEIKKKSQKILEVLVERSVLLSIYEETWKWDDEI